MGLIERLLDELVASPVPLNRRAASEALRRLLPDEAPLAGPEVARAVVDRLVGLGPLEALLRDPAVTDVLVNRPDDVWVERAGTLQRVAAAFPDDGAVVAAVERVIAPLGLRLDHASPSVDARLPDGSRLAAVIPPVAIDGPVVAVRRFTQTVPDFDALVTSGSIDRDGAALLRDAVVGRRSIVVSGGTGAGKTTLLNVLSTAIPSGERVVTVEDAAELRLAGHVVRLEARPPNSEGAGAISMEDMLRMALRLRPDRVIVGEVRGPEALDMVMAMNTGHAGSMSTVHANSPDEALWRIETLALSGARRVRAQAVRRQLRAGVDLLVQLERRDGRRRVAQIQEVLPDRLEELYSC